MALEATAQAVADDWKIELRKPFELSRHSFVAAAGAGAVLKVTASNDHESDQEPEALQLWGGDGCPRLLRHDPGRRAILIERALPGDDISSLSAADATAIAVHLGLRLWRPAGAPFRWIGDFVPDWLEEADPQAGPRRELVALARELYGSLSVERGTLIHGDLHHHNILRAREGHVAIDPKPMLGEPEFDVPSFLWNPIAYRITVDETERRISAFAAAGLREERIRAWAVIRGAYLASDEDLGVLRRLV